MARCGKRLNLSPSKPWALGRRGRVAAWGHVPDGHLTRFPVISSLSPTKGGIFSATLGPAEEEENHGIIVAEAVSLHTSQSVPHTTGSMVSQYQPCCG